MRRAHSRKKRLTQNPAPIPEVLLTAQFIGYARVSTEEQVLDVQLRALQEIGCDIIFQEKESARNAKRPEFNAMLKHVERGDTIVAYAFSRISRNLKFLLGFVDDMEAAGVNIVSTSEPHIKPFTTLGRMMLSMVGTVDEHEVNRVKDRTKDAMAEKKLQGMYLGRPKLVSPEQAKQMIALRKAGVKVPVISKRFHVSDSAVYSHT